MLTGNADSKCWSKQHQGNRSRKNHECYFHECHFQSRSDTCPLILAHNHALIKFTVFSSTVSISTVSISSMAWLSCLATILHGSLFSFRCRDEPIKRMETRPRWKHKKGRLPHYENVVEKKKDMKGKRKRKKKDQKEKRKKKKRYERKKNDERNERKRYEVYPASVAYTSNRCRVVFVSFISTMFQ